MEESFFHGKNILITGGTGFFGKAIVEKLLRSVPKIGKIFIIIRSKKGFTPASRLQKEIINSPIFDSLRKKLGQEFQSYVNAKLHAISGDICIPNLGIDEQDMKLLQGAAHLVIHCAATVQFNEPLNVAAEMNCIGALNMLKFVKNLPKILSYLHVSTAYVNSNQRNCTIDEKLYPLDFNVDETLQSILEASPVELEKLHVNLVGPYPNTYTITKSMAEHLIDKHRGDVPVIIFRPTIIGAAWKDPVPGWVDQVAGAGAIFLACGMGVLTILPGNPRGIADVIPVDMAVNCLLSSICAYSNGSSQLQIVHSGTSDARENPLRWRVACSVVPSYWHANPPHRQLFPSRFTMLQSPQNFQMQWFLRYALPSSVYSTVANAVDVDSHAKKAASLWKLTWRARSLVELFKPFTENQWIFRTDQLNFMREQHHMKNLINSTDADLFAVDSKDIVWERYIQNFCFGLSKWVLHEDMIDVDKDTVLHTQLALNSGRILEWDPDHHIISFPGLFSDLSWAYTSSRKPGYTKSGLLGRFMALTGWREGANHEASHVPRLISESQSSIMSYLIGCESVQLAISGKESENKRAREIMNQMVSAGHFNGSKMRQMAWLLRKILRRLFEDIKVQEKGLEKVRSLLLEQIRYPVVLVPTHRSYIDFLILSFLCFAYNLPLPYVAAGEDFLNMGIITNALRECGAFFIRRSFHDDPLYSAIFNEYTQYLLSKGHVIEFFIEGTRSRSGKQLYPKFGMLSSIVDCFNNGKVDQVHIVPITIDYEKPLELFLHQQENLGEGKIRESFLSLLKSSRVLRHRFGCISVQFGKVIELKDFMKQQRDTPSLTTKEAQFRLTKRLAFTITDSMMDVSACMPSHLLATILLMYRNGISKSQLVLDMDWLRLEVLSRGGIVLCTCGSSRLAMVERAIKLLDKLVLWRRKDVIEPAITNRDQYPNMIGLGYYRNKILHWFFKESIVACSYYSLSSATEENGNPILKEKVMSESEFLLDLLRKECVLNLGETKPYNLLDTLQNLSRRQIISVNKGGEVAVSSTGESKYSLLCNLIWPFVDSYWVAIVSLFALQPYNGIEPSELIQRMQWLAETMYHERVILHYESCSLETLKNSLAILHEWNIVQTKTVSVGKSQKHMVYISEEYQQEKNLRKLALRVAKFRKLPASIQNSSHINQLFAELPVLAKL